MNQPILLANALAVWSFLLTPGLAQVATDQTLKNESSVVEQLNNRFLIKGGATRGKSLFHSLKDLSIRKGQEVYFSNPNNINIILTRVTGGRPSDINGKLGVLGDADLFLMNPSGIHFGPNASLKLNGSFIATTGDSFVFEDGKKFSAINPQPVPDLIVSIPLGIQFKGNSKSISIGNDSSSNNNQNFTFELNINSGKTFSLISDGLKIYSGDINLKSGKFEIISLNEGLIKILANHDSYRFSPSSISRFSDIYIKRTSIEIIEDLNITNSFNDIEIKGRNIVFDNTSINNIAIRNKSIINIFSDNLDLKNSLIKSISEISNSNLYFEISNLFIIQDNSGIESSSGDFGNVIINSNLLVALKNSSIKLDKFSGKGNLIITANGIIISEDSEISVNSFSLEGLTSFNPPFDIRNIPKLANKTQKIVRACRPGQSLGNSTFVNVGRGGVPLGPHHIQTPPSIWQDLREPHISSPRSESSESHKKFVTTKRGTSNQSSDSTSASTIVEAQGWSRDKKGRVILIANASKLIAYDPGQSIANC